MILIHTFLSFSSLRLMIMRLLAECRYVEAPTCFTKHEGISNDHNTIHNGEMLPISNLTRLRSKGNAVISEGNLDEG